MLQTCRVDRELEFEPACLGQDEHSAHGGRKHNHGQECDLGPGHPASSWALSVMSVCRRRCNSVATAKPMAISTVITANITSSRTWPDGSGARNHQNPAAANNTPLIISSSPIITRTTTC